MSISQPGLYQDPDVGPFRFRVWIQIGDRHLMSIWKLHSQFHDFEAAASSCRRLDWFDIDWILVDVDLQLTVDRS